MLVAKKKKERRKYQLKTLDKELNCAHRVSVSTGEQPVQAQKPSLQSQSILDISLFEESLFSDISQLVAYQSFLTIIIYSVIQ